MQALSTQEGLVRVEPGGAVVIHKRGAGAASSSIQHGPLQYDHAGRTASIDGKNLELSTLELGLLEVLL